MKHTPAPSQEAELLISFKNPLLRGGRGCVFSPLPEHTPLSPLKRGIRELNSPALKRGFLGICI